LIQFSDVHLGRYFSLKRLEEITSKIEHLQPDILCFTGDLFDAMNGYPNDKIIPILSKLKAPYGKFAVLGNHDYRSGKKTVTNLLESCGFRVLINERDLVKRAGKHIQMVGVDEILHGQPDLSAALGDNPEQLFTILLAHEPDYADHASGFPIDLQISGHSHGGQIRLPILGALFTPEYGQKYVQGLYKVKDSSLLVYTNRGIGTTQLPFRLFCRPELTVFTLQV
jgi:predicted MPP superfamily phosphohydrolase